METTRRVFLRHLSQLSVAVVGLLSPLRGRAQSPTRWRVRRARVVDAADLAEIFNAHLAAGICPYADHIEPWTAQKARGFLGIYTGTVILDRDTVPVGFAGLIDYADPSTRSWIAPDAEPEVPVVALQFQRLGASDVVATAKRLAATIARELQGRGFGRCRMLISAQPMFASDTWFRRYMTVRAVRWRHGRAYALDVSIDVGGCLAGLEQEGF